MVGVALTVSVALACLIFLVLLAALFILVRLHFLIDYATNLSINHHARQMSRTLDLQPLPGLVREDLIASCTTTANRLTTVALAVESILLQSVRPARILIYLPDGIPEARIPPALLRLKTHDVELRFVPDVGPHTKLIYALRDFPDRFITTFDDDIYYPVNSIETLLDTAEKAPGAIVGNWVRQLRFGWTGKVRKSRAGKLITPESQIVQIERAAQPLRMGYDYFAYGTSGVLYPAGCFDERVFDIDCFRRLCPSEDDVWFKAMSLLNGTPVAATALGLTPKHHCLQGSQKVALRHRNHAGRTKPTASQIQAVFAHFDLYSRLKALSHP
jgi:hypothetical protein